MVCGGTICILVFDGRLLQGEIYKTCNDNSMPGSQWFTGAELNYAENIFSKMTDERPAMLFKAEDKPIIEISWQELYQQTNQLAAAMREMGVSKGDRVVNFMPNRPESIIALLATASIGAIWSSCSPDLVASSYSLLVGMGGA